MVNDFISNYDLQWYVNGTVVTGESGTSFTHTHDVSGTYVISCKATSGANSYDTSVNMEILPCPDMAITVLEGNAGEDYGKVDITAADGIVSASWKREGVEVGTWNTVGKTAILPIGNYTLDYVNVLGNTGSKTFTVRTSPVCIPVTPINPALETTYELAGEQYVSSIKDHEGNVYNVLQIGTRCWTRENMRATTSPTTGSYLILPSVTMKNSASKGATWPIDSADAVNKDWGVQYNWQAMVDVYNSSYPEICAGRLTVDVAVPHITHPHRGICPEGWHVPVNADFSDLHAKFPYMGQLASNNGDGTNSWTTATGNSPGNVSYAERNASGFSAVPAGMDGGSNKNAYAIFWTGTEYSVPSQNWRGYLKAIQYDFTTQNWYAQDLWHHEMCAVRCIRNN